jgi:hypothetical protein
MRGRSGVKLARRAILPFGLLNAALFSALLPLWEGFDEAYHYGYVEELWQSRRLPVLGRTPLPYDVVASFRLTPVSSVTRRAIPEATPFDAWFALPEAERARRRSELDGLRSDSRRIPRGNYQAHQPPLSYLLLAPLDRTLACFPLPERVLWLRLVCGAASVLLLYFGASNMFRELQLPPPYETIALFVVFSTEMLYATIAHIANDWLAVGCSVCFLASLLKFVRAPGPASALHAAVWLAGGLVTKSYFPIFAILSAVAAGVLLWRRRVRVAAFLPGGALVLLVAGPWYARNLVLYGALGATPEGFEGVGFKQVLRAAPRVNWLAAAGYLARGSLWTGNNSFTTFSRVTLDFVLTLLALGLAVCVARLCSARMSELLVFLAMLLFLAGIAYETCAMVASRGADVAGPHPWYAQVLLVPVFGLACLGFSRLKHVGRVLSAVLTALCAWILIATWVLKLFPLYSGGGSAPVRARDLWMWRLDTQTLSLTALAPPQWLYAGLAASLALTLAIAALLVSTRFWQQPSIK